MSQTSPASYREGLRGNKQQKKETWSDPQAKARGDPQRHSQSCNLQLKKATESTFPSDSQKRGFVCVGKGPVHCPGLCLTSREHLNCTETPRKAHLETLPRVPESGTGAQLAPFLFFPCVMVFYDFQEVKHKNQALHFTSSNQIWLSPPCLAKTIHHPPHLNMFQWVLQPSPVKLCCCIPVWHFKNASSHHPIPIQPSLGSNTWEESSGS